MNANAPIQILGAGLTGMSAAHHLEGLARVHERLAHAGGHAITLAEDGFRFDRTGHLLHLRDPQMKEWVTKLIGDDAVWVQRKSLIFSHGVYTRYPYQANTYGLPADVAYECLMGFLDALAKKDSVPTPTNFEEFCLKHFGEGFSKHFMIPYNSRLWGVHPREITAEWCSRFVPMPKLEDVIAGAVGKNARELGYNTGFLYPKRGIGELPSAMAKSLGDTIRYSRSPERVDWRNKKLVFSDGEVPYAALISTMPLDTLVGLMHDVPASVASASKKLRCNPLWYLDVALDVPCGIDLHWVYVPEEKYPFYRVGCYSNFSDEMAPPGKSCLYVELASRDEPNMAELLPVVARGLMDMQIISKPEDIRFARPRFLRHAYVLYDHDYYPAVEAIHPFLLENGIVSAGRYGAWNYSSMEDALIFGRNAAAQARKILG
jgi:protoporphyrinogen oxidase